MMSITIRPMAADDAPRVGEVHVGAWRAAYRGIMADEYLDGLLAEDRADMWRRINEDRRGSTRDVIVVDDQIVGFAAYGPAHDPVADPSVDQLYAINVHPDHWSRGIGRRLLRHVTAELAALGCRRAGLWVVTGNERARRFY